MNYNVIKNGAVLVMILFAQKVWAQDVGATLYGVPISRKPFLLEVLVKFAIPLFLLIIFISAIISPIIGYRWYAKHGGAKKWIGWLAYLPLLIAAAIVFGYFLRDLMR